MTLYTTNDVATRLGVHPGHVRKMAVSLGVGQRIGRDWLFTADDVRRLEQRNTKPGPRARKEG